MNIRSTAVKTTTFVLLSSALSLWLPAQGQGQSVPAEVPGQTYYAAFPVSISVDGNFSDWAGFPQASVVDGPQPGNPADGSLIFAAAADATTLYFTANVTDSSIIAGQHGENYWNEDSVEIYINGSGDFGLASYTGSVAQITIPAANLGRPADQTIISGINVQGLGVRAVVVPLPGGYGIEAAVPLQTSAWNITPANGGSLGFEVQLNGATQTDRSIKLSWSNKDKAQDLAYQNPSVFGQLSFFQLGGNLAPSQPTLPPPLPTEIMPSQPTALPTDLPIVPLPTALPTDLPKVQLTTALPTNLPTIAPTLELPTALPTDLPTSLPTLAPTLELPTALPTASLTPAVPALQPTIAPVYLENPNLQGPLVRSEVPGENYYAVFPAAITIDGNFNDWAGLPLGRVTEGPQPAAKASDGSLTFAAAADANNLYFTANVTDSNLIAGQHGENYWNEDSVELYINATGNLGLTSYTTGVVQITIPAANVSRSAAQTIIVGQNVDGMGIRAVVVRLPSGYGLEVAVPLRTSAWNITPTNGGSLGFEVQLNGATQRNRNIKLSWSNKDKAQDLAYQNPSVFGLLTFSGGSSSAATPLPTAMPPTVMPPTVVPPTAVPPTAAPAGGFSVQGSTIIGPNGQPFIARGVNVNGYNWVWQRRTVDDASLIVDCWKFNLVRVNSFLFGGQPWAQYSDNNDLDAIVRTFTSRGVVVLFEAHDRIGTYYQGEDLTRLVDWFRGLAQRYKGNPYVWFDVSNEPGGRGAIDATAWINMHQQVIRAIRDTGANNIIMVEGATGGQDAGSSGSNFVRQGDSAILSYASQVMTFGGRTYPNIVFSIHPYDLWNFGDAKMADFFNQVKARNLVMIVGEYGVQTDQNTTAAASSVINTAPPLGVGHIVWHWDGHDYNDLTARSTWGGGWEINNCSNPTNLSWLGLSVWIDNHK